jgi:hypothetical protein
MQASASIAGMSEMPLESGPPEMHCTSGPSSVASRQSSKYAGSRSSRKASDERVARSTTAAVDATVAQALDHAASGRNRLGDIVLGHDSGVGLDITVEIRLQVDDDLRAGGRQLRCTVVRARAGERQQRPDCNTHSTHAPQRSGAGRDVDVK